MSFLQILITPAMAIKQMRFLWLSGLIMLVLATFYPSDLKNGYGFNADQAPSALVENTEEWGRLTNTVLQLAIPIILRDVTGLKQLVVITVAGIAASHGPKRLLNDVVVGGTRLGQRPYGEGSRHNMPSGHSTLAASGAVFLMRRYSWWWGLITVPVTLLTMYARVMLDMHTISAVIAGCLVGLLVTALFVTKKTRKNM